MNGIASVFGDCRLWPAQSLKVIGSLSLLPPLKFMVNSNCRDGLVPEGDQIPRKEGSAIQFSGLMIVDKIDLAP